MLLVRKLPEASAWITAEITVASPPPDSSGAWKCIAPSTSPVVTSVSEVCKFNIAPSEVLAVISPITSSLVLGDVVPIPTLPVLLILYLSINVLPWGLVKNRNVPA